MLGSSYSPFRLRVANASQGGGAPAGATLGVGIDAGILIPRSVQSIPFGPAESKFVDYAISVPDDPSGLPSKIDAWVQDPNANVLASDSEAVQFAPSMAVFGLGKGLYEPCSPGRQAYFFGNPTGSQNADGWNCAPEMMGETNVFDLVGMGSGVGVAVLRAIFFNIPKSLVPGNGHPVAIKWFRGRDSALLGVGNSYIPDPGAYGYTSWLWYYVYSVINTPIENGAYYIDVLFDQVWARRMSFTVTGGLS